MFNSLSIRKQPFKNVWKPILPIIPNIFKASLHEFTFKQQSDIVTPNDLLQWDFLYILFTTQDYKQGFSNISNDWKKRLKDKFWLVTFPWKYISRKHLRFLLYFFYFNKTKLNLHFEFKRKISLQFSRTGEKYTITSSVPCSLEVIISFSPSMFSLPGRKNCHVKLGEKLLNSV